LVGDLVNSISQAAWLASCNLCFFGTSHDQKVANRTGKTLLDVSRRAACAFSSCLAQSLGCQRLDFFFFVFFVFFGIIFFTAFLAFLATDFAALTTRLVTDFFDFLAMLTP
jgi:hypothetical protein